MTEDILQQFAQVLMNLRKFLTNILTMNVSIPNQFVKFRIHFYGENPQNFLLQNQKLYFIQTNGRLYHKIMKDFINEHIYNIFDRETIGEIEYERIGNQEYYTLKKYVPSFIQIPKKQLQTIKGNV